MYLPDQKLIFIHILKCAGTSVEILFAGRDWAELDPRTKHLTAQMSLALHGRDVWNACFKFSIVRNPWARFLSFFNLVRTVEPSAEFGLCLRYPLRDAFGQALAIVRPTSSQGCLPEFLAVE